MALRLKIPPNIRYILTVVVLLLVLNFILRLAFLFYNTAQATAMPFSDILLSFVVGVRFDLATIFIFNGLILFFLSLPIRANRQRRTYKIANILIILANVPVLLFNFIDVVYYSYSEKRLTHELFTTASDYQSFKPEMLVEWWYLFLFFIVLVYLFYRVLNFYSRRHLNQNYSADYVPKGKHWVGTVVFALFVVMGIRGGLQRTPLWMGKAFVGSSIFAGNLGLNSGFTVVSCVDWWEKEPVRLVDDNDKAVEVAREMVQNSFDGPFYSEEYPLLRKSSFTEGENRYNVVFLIIESLNARHVGSINGTPLEQSMTPNLDTLTRHARLYSRYYSNGTRSVEAVPALLNSMPDIFERPTIGSRYSDNQHYGLGQILKERGYTNAFFCGAHNGTMGFDKYSKTCGIDNYFGMDEYPHSERDFDGFWGCYDGPFLQWMAEQQNSFGEPFLSVFFSISNHHPFNLPPHNTEDIAKLPYTAMEKTTMYTDRVLGEYFRTVSQYDWYKRTIFIVTGDHCFHEESEPGRPIMENFHVPLWILAPCLEPGKDERLANHINVMPTLIDLMRLETAHSSTGVSLLEDDREPFVINNLMGVSTLALGDIAYSTNFERMQPFHRLRNGKWEQEEDPEKLDQEIRENMDFRLRSMYQVLLNARIGDRLHCDPMRSVLSQAGGE